MNRTKKIILAGLFTALSALGAFIRIPLPYVPIVLQGFFVILAGLILGSKWGFLSQLAYLIIGLAGIPIFTNGGGIGYVLQPTFGYLMGYALGAFVTGFIVEKSKAKNIKTYLLASFACIMAIYLIGVPYLAVIMHFVIGNETAVSYAVVSGFLITLPGDIIKALLAAFIGIRLSKTIKID